MNRAGASGRADIRVRTTHPRSAGRSSGEQKVGRLLVERDQARGRQGEAERQRDQALHAKSEADRQCYRLKRWIALAYAPVNVRRENWVCAAAELDQVEFDDLAAVVNRLSSGGDRNG